MTITSTSAIRSTGSSVFGPDSDGTANPDTTDNASRQTVLAALKLLQVAVADLSAGQLDAAEMQLDRVDALSAASPWVTSAARWLQDEISVSRPGAGVRIARRAPSPTPVAATDRVAAEFALTEREAEVLELVSRGFSSKQIGRELFISGSTVAYHLGNMYAKTGVTTRHQLSALLWQDAPRRTA